MYKSAASEIDIYYIVTPTRYTSNKFRHITRYIYNTYSNFTLYSYI